MTSPSAGADPARPDTRGIPEWVPVAVLAVVCYVPLLLTHRGQVGADTKSYLYLDPDRLLGRAWSMWDPNVGLGTVPHQNIGYLWPMGPYYWVFEHLGIPDWIAQRLWLGSILLFAGLGVRYMLRSLGQSGAGVTVAMFLYALSPYVLTLGARLSVILLPFTALGWLLGLTIRATRERSWLHPALFALAVPTFGSTNATALLLMGLAPAAWIVWATLVGRELRVVQALGVVARIGVLSVGTSIWWIVGLWCQGQFGIDVLRYTETARTVANASTAGEILRGIGYWYFYGDDKFGAWIEPSVAYTQNPGLIALTYALPVVALVAATAVRWRYRSFFVGLVVMGAIISIGAHPWNDPTPAGVGFKAFLESQAGLAMRSLPRAVPLLTLGLAVLTGSAVTALGRRRPRLEPAVAGAFVLIALIALPPLWRGQLVADNLQRREQLPTYWVDAATAIDGRDRDGDGYSSRVLEVPGSDFASYRWGNTVDPITPGITDRPYAARELIPYGSAASAELLTALDRQMQEASLDPRAVAAVARLMGVGDIVLRSDLAYERYNLVRPREAFALLEAAPGLDAVTGFGGTSPNVPDPRLPLEDELELGTDPTRPDPPKVGLYRVSGDPSMISAKPESSTLMLAGSADGIIAGAAAGLIEGDELVRYSASFSADGGGGTDALRAAVVSGVPLVVTDTNRRSGRRWGTVHETDGYTETVGEEPLLDDPTDNRLVVFPGAGPSTQTVAVHRGGVTARATSFGNAVSYTPEDRPASALDDDLDTSWYMSAFANAIGERIEITYDSPKSTDRIRVLQASRGVQNRWITKVRVRFDGEDPVVLELGPRSRKAGQWLTFPKHTFSTFSIEIAGTDPGRRDTYDDLSGVGFADIRLGDGDVRLEESMRPPTDLLSALGTASTDHPLAFVFTRRRSRPSAALRTDEETHLVRDVILPEGRSFGLTGTARLSATAGDALLDAVLGRPTLAEGGIEAASSRRLPGDIGARSSSAIDGDPTTHWSPGFLGQNAEWASYETVDPITFDHMDLRVVADGRHTVPTRLRIVADGRTAAVVDVPRVRDDSRKDATTLVPVDLPSPVTGRRIEIHIDDSREVVTNDWISRSPVVMPVGIAEWGIAGLEMEPPRGRFDSGCRDDLLTIDGEAQQVRVTGTVDDAVDGEPLDVELCGQRDISLPKGTSILRTAKGDTSGVQLDALTLRSEPGERPDRITGPLIDDVQPVDVDVRSRDRWRATVELGPRPEDTWLVIGQSVNDGWRASADGRDLGPPVLVDGYSAAFRVPAGSDPVEVDIVWRPQRTVFMGLIVSAIAVLVCIGLVAWSLVRRRRRGTADSDEAGEVSVPDTKPGHDDRPDPLRLANLFRSAGTAVPAGTTALVTLFAGLAGTLAINPVAGAAAALVTLAGLRWDRARPALTLGPAILLVAAGAFVVIRQVRFRLPPGFRWPQRFEEVHGVAYLAVLVLGIEVVVSHLRRRTAAANSTMRPTDVHTDA